MNAAATSGGVVKGPMMVILKEYVATANPEEVKARLEDWSQARESLADAARDLELASSKLPEAFQETSFTTEAATRAFRTASEKLNTKVRQLDAAISALTSAQNTTQRAQDTHKKLEGGLPSNHGPAPDPSSPQYAQSGTGVDSAKAGQNQKALQSDRAAFAAREQAIAEAEAAAAEQINLVDQENYTAEPPVREITDEPGTESNNAPTNASSPGSYSEVAAARARMAKYNSGTLYPDGMGHELIAQEKANIESHLAENKPELRDGQWVNADGSAAPATSYAMVETADGLAPLAGGTGGMSALAIGGGGALLGAGVAKALANKFAAGRAAKAATAGGASRSAAARSAAAKAGTAGARAGAGAAGRGAGARGAGAGARGAGARGAGGRGATGAGSRGGAGAGRGGKKKDDKQNSQDQDWQADYTEDWTETASDVLDPGAARGWVPDTPQGDGSNQEVGRRRDERGN